MIQKRKRRNACYPPSSKLPCTRQRAVPPKPKAQTHRAQPICTKFSCVKKLGNVTSSSSIYQYPFGTLLFPFFFLLFPASPPFFPAPSFLTICIHVANTPIPTLINSAEWGSTSKVISLSSGLCTFISFGGILPSMIVPSSFWEPGYTVPREEVRIMGRRKSEFSSSPTHGARTTFQNCLSSSSSTACGSASHSPSPLPEDLAGTRGGLMIDLILRVDCSTIPVVCVKGRTVGPRSFIKRQTGGAFHVLAQGSLVWVVLPHPLALAPSTTGILRASAVLASFSSSTGSPHEPLLVPHALSVDPHSAPEPTSRSTSMPTLSWMSCLVISSTERDSVWITLTLAAFSSASNLSTSSTFSFSPSSTPAPSPSTLTLFFSLSSPPSFPAPPQVHFPHPSKTASPSTTKQLPVILPKQSLSAILILSGSALPISAVSGSSFRANVVMSSAARSPRSWFDSGRTRL